MDLNKVIRETLTLLEHQLAKASVEVKLALDETVPKIKGNPGKLQQVFLNLFLNARDAMESGGVLALRTTSHETHGSGLVRVTVADSGAGIAHENLTRIFDPFFTTKAARKGTGLGLSVSYGIVREHGGEIEVESEPGAGTRFELSFPVTVSGKRAEPARVEAASLPAVPQMPHQAAASMLSSAPSSAPSSPAPAVARSDRLMQ